MHLTAGPTVPRHLFTNNSFIYSPDIYSPISHKTLPKPPTADDFRRQLKRRGVLPPARPGALMACVLLPSQYVDPEPYIKRRTLMRKVIIRLLVPLLLALGLAAPALAHQAGPCTPSAEPGHSEFAQHHIVPFAQEGALGAGGHVPGSHAGFSLCNPSGP